MITTGAIMQWESRKHGGYIDHYIPGYVIVGQVYGRQYCLYRTFPDSEQADGIALVCGSLESCKAFAEFLAK